MSLPHWEEALLSRKSQRRLDGERGGQQDEAGRNREKLPSSSRPPPTPSWVCPGREGKPLLPLRDALQG